MGAICYRTGDLGRGLGIVAVERQQSVGREPMLAHIVAGDVRQAAAEMRFRRLHCERAARIVRGERGGKGTPAPGTSEVEPVEMGDLAVAAVADNGRPE